MSDMMLIGVLRMPMPDDPDPLTLRQLVDRARQAADWIEADAAKIEMLRQALLKCKTCALPTEVRELLKNL